MDCTNNYIKNRADQRAGQSNLMDCSLSNMFA